MGYDLHITRAEDWSESEDVPISLDEWLEVASSDASLVRDTQMGDAFFSFADRPEPRAWFDWDEGQVFSKNPDRAVLVKALDLAAALDAHVQGDDGEPYAAPEDFDLSPRELAERRPDARTQDDSTAKRRFWRR